MLGRGERCWAGDPPATGSRPGLHSVVGRPTPQRAGRVEPSRGEEHRRMFGRRGTVADQAHHADEPKSVEFSDRSAIDESEPLDAIHGANSRRGDDLVAGDTHRSPDAIALRDESDPVLHARVRRRSGDDPTAGTVDGGRSVQRALVDVKECLAVATGDNGRPCIGVTVEEVDLEPAPRDHVVNQQVATIGAQRHVGPRLHRRRPIPNDLVIGVLRPKQMEPNVAVVLVASGIAGVEKSRLVGHPRHARSAGIGDLIAAMRAGIDVEHLQGRPFGATLAHPVCHKATRW